MPLEVILHLCGHCYRFSTGLNEHMKKYLSSALALSALVMAAAAAPANAQVTSLNQGFDTVSTLVANGWALPNYSDPAPLVAGTTWAQGSTPQSGFVGQAGGNNSFIQADISITSGDITGANGTVSAWIITPELSFTNGGTISFYARTIGTQTKSEFLEVRQSNTGTSTGFSAAPAGTDLGNFTNLVGSAGGLTDNEINPSLAAIPFANWKQYTFNVAAGTSGRLAFRYFATDGGPNGTQSLYLGVDTLSYTATEVPEPSSILGTLMIGGLAAASRMRKMKRA
jgi:hypothetical protein